MNIKNAIKLLKKLRACSDAVKWAEQFNTPQEAWDKCERGDWMLWLAGKQVGSPRTKSRKKLVLTACACARLTLPIWDKYNKKDKRVRQAVIAAEKWAKGQGVSLQEVRLAADAAADAATDAADAAYAARAAARAAAYAAADAAYAADAAADAAYAADVAAYAAAYAAADAAYAASCTRKKTLKKCANIVRKFYPDVNKILGS